MATHREQVAALAGLLAYHKCVLPPEAFRGTWAVALAAITESGSFAEAKRRLERVLPANHLQDILEALPPERPPWVSLEDLALDLQPVEWLWPGWIPRGMLSLLGAAPGAGKSFLALDLARRIIEGGAFPDGMELVGQGRVVYVDAENVPQLLNERAGAWGMRKDRLFPMLPEAGLMLDLCGEADQDRLWQMCSDLSPAMVVVDSLGAASSKGENAVEEVRDLLAFLNGVAVDFGTAMLLVHHLRKSQRPMLDWVSIYDFRGSGHIVAMARSILGLSIVQESSEFDRNGPRRLEVVKSNLGPYPAPMGMRFVGEGDGVRLEYGAVPRRHRVVSRVEECAAWLVEVLEEAGETVEVGELVEAAEEEGYGRRMLFRARRRLGERVVDAKGRGHPENEWGLSAD